MKQVLYVSARRAPVRDASGKDTQTGFKGVFSLDVPEGTKGAYHYSGVIDNRPWSKWQKEAGVIRGRVRWVDVCKKKFGTKLYLFVENDNALYRIEFQYDTKHLKQLGNLLLGIKKDLRDGFYNFLYDVWQQKHPDGKPKLNKKDKPMWATAIKIPDATPWKTSDELKVYMAEKSLEWEQVYDAQKDAYTFDSSKEMTFWLNVLAGIQRELLVSCADVCTPFTYDSVLATTNPHPMGVKTLDENDLAACTNIYESIKGQYKMPFKTDVEDADDAFFSLEQEDDVPQAAPAKPAHAPQSIQDDFPTEEPRYGSTGNKGGFPTEEPRFEDTLPF